MIEDKPALSIRTYYDATAFAEFSPTLFGRGKKSGHTKRLIR
jgi:hypothetical protein